MTQCCRAPIVASPVPPTRDSNLADPQRSMNLILGNFAITLFHIHFVLVTCQCKRLIAPLNIHVGKTQMIILSRTVVLALCFTLAFGGCVSIDPRALHEQIRPDSATSIVGTFKNRASYGSGREFVPRDTLSFALGVHHIKPISVTVSRPSESELRFEFQNDDESKFAKTYTTATGLTVKANGQFDVPVPVGCGGHDSPGFGCGAKTLTLFINPYGNLAAIESGGGAGLIGFIPIAVYAKHLALFSRIR